MSKQAPKQPAKKEEKKSLAKPHSIPTSKAVAQPAILPPTIAISGDNAAQQEKGKLNTLAKQQAETNGLSIPPIKKQSLLSDLVKSEKGSDSSLHSSTPSTRSSSMEGLFVPSSSVGHNRKPSSTCVQSTRERLKSILDTRNEVSKELSSG
jgi:hypothetical protein